MEFTNTSGIPLFTNKTGEDDRATPLRLELSRNFTVRLFRQPSKMTGEIQSDSVFSDTNSADG